MAGVWGKEYFGEEKVEENEILVWRWWHGGMGPGEVILVVTVLSVLDYKYMSIWNTVLESCHLDLDFIILIDFNLKHKKLRHHGICLDLFFVLSLPVFFGGA